jgi:hypothetical protein
MANPEHLEILKQGVEKHPEIQPDLIEADLKGTSLFEFDLSGANLYKVSLVKADLFQANLSNVDLRGAYLPLADLSGAILTKANLSNADLQGVSFDHADLRKANLSNANLSGATFIKADISNADLNNADISGARLIDTNMTGTILTGCRVYGISVWDVQLESAKQFDLDISPYMKTITVDNLKVAQFIYLLLNNTEIRDVIDTIAKKVVLILGRFTPERKQVLDALRDELRRYNLLPVVFDFDPSAKRDLTETISTLAHLSRFIIADLTDAKSIPQELEAIVPHLPSVPVQPIL